MTIEALRDKLYKVQPYKVRLFQGDEAVRDVAAGKGRKRWTGVIEACERIAWSSAELLDKSGATLAVVDNATPATDLEPLDGAQAGREDRLLNLLIRAQREALTYRDKDSAAALQACTQVMRELGAAVLTLAKLYREQVDVATSTALMRAAGSGAEGKEDDLMSSPMMQALLPELLKRLMAPPPVASSTNGANGTNGHKAAPPNGAK
jgi:hypothetical protein